MGATSSSPDRLRRRWAWLLLGLAALAGIALAAVFMPEQMHSPWIDQPWLVLVAAAALLAVVWASVVAIPDRFPALQTWAVGVATVTTTLAFLAEGWQTLVLLGLQHFDG
jgi:cytochrome bd-type quinol oxidase subunit 2